MMTARVAVMMTVLTLAGITSWTPVAQAEESNEAALRSQLEAVQQQLHELQFKVQRMESELGAATHSSTPAPATVAPAAGGIPSPTPVMPAGAAATPMPPSTAVPVPAASSSVSPSTTSAPVRVEAGPSTTAIPEAFQWREMLKAQWRSIKAGMSSEEIRKLLGTPSREFALDGKPVWYYSYPGIGNGSVMFSRDGHTVAGWQHPPYGFW
jgi:hypothetical protein